MKQNATITIRGPEGENLTLRELSYLILKDPETQEEIDILVLIDEDENSCFFEVIDEDTIEQIKDPDLIEALMNVSKETI